MTQNNADKIPSHPWEYPGFHVDYAGPFMQHIFLVIVDAYTKWPEIFPTTSTNAQATVGLLRQTFARFGSPVTLVSKNGPQFRSSEFEEFLKSNGIIHKVTAPYNPSTNGEAERYVQILKQGLGAMKTEPGDISQN
jgi:hypothetical protein